MDSHFRGNCHVTSFTKINENLNFQFNDETPPKSSPYGWTFIAPYPWGEGWDGVHN